MREIYLIRHGETEHTRKKRCIGVTDVILNENGRRQARCLRDYFRNKELSGIYCSDALRAVQTADIISGGSIPVTRLAELHEINMGDWDGMYFEDIQSEFPEGYRQRGLALATFAPPKGENFADCQCRAFNVLREVLDHTAGNIAVVAHAGFNRALICGLCRRNLQELFTVPQPFGCVNILSVCGGVCRVRQVGLSVDGSH